MSSYIQNYGFTKTFINDKHNTHNEIQFKGDYDGNIANIDIGINDNGSNKFVSIHLNNNDLGQIFGIQSIEIPIEKRLMNDFLMHKPYKPIILEGALIKRKTRKYKRIHHRRRKSHKNI